MGERAALLFVIQRADCSDCTIAADIDPAYAQAYVAARDAGVACFAYQCEVGAAEIRLGKILPMV
jgi:sugar fermentation stimulation protein A